MKSAVRSDFISPGSKVFSSVTSRRRPRLKPLQPFDDHGGIGVPLVGGFGEARYLAAEDRLVAIQLLKRFRDIQFRGRDGPCPPSVVIAAMALDAGQMSDSLCDELIAIATHIQREIENAERDLRKVVVANPAHPADVFTDRWPEDGALDILFNLQER
ncbi:hypothetical protein ACC755_35905 [Rhizobium ruizarguesonis]|uniref:hypothetical protein n=1 Tax=Rhizobium ruizarguesonis TaxID=2081791 RepID=UPI001FDF4EF6|nr:hypothetical protein [Rhizobium ruizarguesonis]